MKLWYMTDSNGHIEHFESAEEAKAAAEHTLQFYREAAWEDGWPEGINKVEWGKLQAVEGSQESLLLDSDGVAYREFTLVRKKAAL